MRAWSVVLAVCVCSACELAFGIDAAPPWRGDPGSSLQEWIFITGGGGGAGVYFEPDGAWANTYGAPMAVFAAGAWIDGGGLSADGAWSGSFSQYWIPNDPFTPAQGKQMRIQMVWKDVAPAASVQDVAGSPWACDSFFDIFLLDGWVLSVQDWSAPSHGEAEMVQITAGGLLDGVTIDTLIVPEPASLSALVLGALALLRRRGR